MKTVLCRQFGPLGDLAIEETAPPRAAAGEVVIRIEACGVNFYDGLAVQGLYQTRPAFPFAPGGEVAGTVAELGEGVDGLAAGQRVMAFTGFGGYAEFVAVPAGFVFPVPDTMDTRTAAAFPIACGTAYHALADRAALGSGETLLVLGAAGGVGLAAVEVGRRLGARAIAAASSAEKLELCRSRGAHETVDYRADTLRDRVHAITGGRGVDVVFDPVGGDVSKDAMRSLATEGRYLVIGFASGTVPEIAFNRLLLRQVSLTGVLWGAFARARPAANAANMATLLAWHQAGDLRPRIDAAYPLDRFAEALDRVMGRAALGKVVIEPAARPREVAGAAA